MTTLSVLDFASITEEGSIAQSLENSARLARKAEELGFYRFWMAEHHAMPGIASAAVSVCLAHVGHATSAIRIGAGGIMLPNHNPFVIAEQFGTLDALFPGRVDLGLGRAPGADGRIAQALRKDLYRSAEAFPQDVVELRALLEGNPQLPLQAIPGAGANVEMWVLGSSLFGAQLAAALGLPYAFAAHFSPAALDDALAAYRERFQPSAACEKPQVMVAVNAYAADSTEDAFWHASSMDQSLAALSRGRPGRLPPPVRDYRKRSGGSGLGGKSGNAIGTGGEVREKLVALIERTGADELMLSGSTYDPAARIRSLEIIAETCAGI